MDKDKLLELLEQWYDTLKDAYLMEDSNLAFDVKEEIGKLIEELNK